MRFAFQVVLGSLALSTMHVGAANAFLGVDALKYLYDIDATGLDGEMKRIIAIQLRILAGLWLAAGLGLALSIKRFERHNHALWIVGGGICFGAVGELTSVIVQGGAWLPAAAKAGAQIGFCCGLELWRRRLCDPQHACESTGRSIVC